MVQAKIGHRLHGNESSYHGTSGGNMEIELYMEMMRHDISYTLYSKKYII